MTPPQLPASPWEVCKHATPEHSPQFGIHSGGSVNGFITVKGSRELADAVAALPDLLEALAAIEAWDPAAAPDEEDGMSIMEAIDTARAALRKAGHTL